GIKGLTSGNGGTFIGDIIIGIDDKNIGNYDDLYNILDEHKPGDKVTVKVRREGEVLSVPVELYVLPE
ncbi:MAG: PDZ domain-containing protein, partial [Proteobacteria bacterium]|nr:PDZ domain-containing protein [Pseudomonadota bacterium]